MSTSQNLYDILGVSRDASDKDIKHAFKTLSRQLHPDRQAGKSDEEKKIAEEKFKDVNHAYSVLSDPQLKANYDQFGTEDPQHMQGGGFPAGGFNFGGFNFNPFDFNPFSGGHSSRQRQVERGKDIQVNVNITIEELFKGTTKKIKYNRPVRCVNCHGTGGSGAKICPECHGSGMHQERRRMGANAWQIINEPCKKCKGTGQVIEHKCPTCSGDGLVKESTTVDINIPSGFIHSQRISKSGYGSEPKTRDGIVGDLLVNVLYDFVERPDLELAVEQGRIHVTQHINVPYYDLMLGCNYNFEAPYGNITVNIPTGIHDGFILDIQNDYGVHYSLAIHYDFPKTMSDEERSHIEAIKNLHN